MKTSKKLKPFILLLICLAFFQNQSKAQELITKKNRFYISPLNLINPIGASSQITYGRVFKNNNEIQLSYSFKHTIDRDVEEGTATDLISGYRLGLEYQFATIKREKLATYFGVETFMGESKSLYNPPVYSSSGPIFTTWGSSTNRPEKVQKYVHQNRLGLNLKIGTKIQVFKNFMIELYSGVGATIVTNNFYAESFDNFQYIKQKGKFNLPTNVKLMMAF